MVVFYFYKISHVFFTLLEITFGNAGYDFLVQGFPFQLCLNHISVFVRTIILRYYFYNYLLRSKHMNIYKLRCSALSNWILQI